MTYRVVDDVQPMKSGWSREWLKVRAIAVANPGKWVEVPRVSPASAACAARSIRLGLNQTFAGWQVDVAHQGRSVYVRINQPRIQSNPEGN